MKTRRPHVYTAERSPYQFVKGVEYWRVLRNGKPYMSACREQQAKRNAEQFNRTQPGNR